MKTPVGRSYTVKAKTHDGAVNIARHKAIADGLPHGPLGQPWVLHVEQNGHRSLAGLACDWEVVILEGWTDASRA